jgi:hypothetical protein
MACVQRSRPLQSKASSPRRSSSTIASIVASVAAPNAAHTAATASQLASAAGYMSSGISDSQGPKAKTMNSAQGVIDGSGFVAAGATRSIVNPGDCPGDCPPAQGTVPPSPVRMQVRREPVVVVVAVARAVGVEMLVAVRPAPQRPLHAPGGVGQPEAEQQPGRHVPAEILDVQDPLERGAGRDADRADQHRAHHVRAAAQPGDPGGAPRRPGARLGEGDERQVMVRAEHGVHEADRGGGQHQQRDVGAHDPSPACIQRPRVVEPLPSRKRGNPDIRAQPPT